MMDSKNQLEENTHYNVYCFKKEEFVANLIKFYQEIRKLYAFEIVKLNVSLMEIAIFVTS